MPRNHPHWNTDDWEDPNNGLQVDDSLLDRRDVELSAEMEVAPSGVTQEQIEDFKNQQNPVVDVGGSIVGDINKELEMSDGKSNRVKRVEASIAGHSDSISQLTDASWNAQQTANSAIEDAARANDELGDLLDLGSENPMALWRLQNAINDADATAAEALSQAVEANTRAIAAMNQEVARMLPCRDGQENDFIKVDPGRIIVCKGAWTGWLYYMGSSPHDGEAVGVQDTSLVSGFSPVPSPNGDRRFYPGGAVDVIFMRVMPGVHTRYSVTTSDQWVLLNQWEWTTVASFTIPEDGSISGSAKFCFTRRTLLADYAARVTVNGQSVTKSVHIQGAPMFGDGPRWANAVISIPEAKAGDVIKLEAYVSHPDRNNRYINNAEMQLDLIAGR